MTITAIADRLDVRRFRRQYTILDVLKANDKDQDTAASTVS